MNIKKRSFIKSLGILLLSITIFNFGIIGYNTAYAEEGEKKVILIDPGHGGIDGGAVSKKGTLEKDITLLISQKLKGELEKNGYKVYMTREEDKGLHGDTGTVRNKKNEDLTNRCKKKKETNCDMFLSIHLNMFPQSKYYGAQVWHANDEESKKLGAILQNTLVEELDPKNNRKEKVGLEYKILKDGHKAPSAIIECGFLSNPEEEEKLKTEDYQKELAEAITKAVNKYYSK